MKVTDIPYAPNFPTPLSTPSVGATAYQLKPWSSASAFDLIDLAEQFSFADNVPQPFGMKRFVYQADQAAIRVAVQEALHRYPGSVSIEKLEWRIALADAILDRPDSDEWILQQIQVGLNSSKIAPDDLDQLLNPHGFQLTYQETAPNLFGDGRSAEVLWITLQDTPYTGLYAAIRQDSQGRYSLERIFSTWDFNFGWDSGQEDTVLEIKDHTGDGIPEVILHPWKRNGGFCGYDLYLFQWKNDQFVDITQGQLSFGILCGTEGTYDFGSPDQRGAQPIETVRETSVESFVNIYRKYEWNGEVYRLTETHLDPPRGIDEGSYAWLNAALDRGEYDQIVQYLSSETFLALGQANLGPSYPDYLRFQLGLAYAFLSDETNARTNFTKIAQRPNNPAATALPNAAQAYLDHYTGEADLYKACQAALAVMKSAASPSPAEGENMDSYYRKVWGYAAGGGLGLTTDLCSLRNAFKVIVSRLTGPNFSQAPSQLEQAGVPVHASVEADLNNDRQAEWVVWTDTPVSTGLSNNSAILWILAKTSAGIKAIGLDYTEALENRSLNAREVTTPEGKSVAFIQAGSYLFIFRMNAEEGTIDDARMSQEDVESYSVYQDTSGLMLEVTKNSNDCAHCKRMYRWFPQAGMFLDAKDPDELKVAAAETALLQKWDLAAAIPLLQDIATFTETPEAPRYFYLLGLAYELNGDSKNAVQAYWQCWSTHPDSIYARLAQAKLDLR
jgi:hypothetical protein